MNQLFRFRKDWPYHVSAGAVVFDKDFNKVCVLKRLAKNFGEDSWHLPKGTLNNNEPLEAAAKREVLEEAGIQIKIIGYLGAMTQQWITSKENLPIDKTTHYFIAQVLSEAGSMDSEHDEIEWLEVKEAKQKLKKVPKREDIIIDRAFNFIRGGFES